MKKIAIILAGGKGNRMKSDIPKQYLPLCGKPVLYYSLATFERSGMDAMILVSGSEDIDYCEKEIIEKYHVDTVEQIVAGGTERYYSVYHGILAAQEIITDNGWQEEDTLVFIHDGARPCIDAETIARCEQDAIKTGACVAAVPVKDTIKVVDEQKYAINTPDRSTLWQIQTPQVFSYPLVRESYDKMIADADRGNITDDAMVVEQYSSHKVKVTMGTYQNIKVTTPEDMQTAEIFLHSEE